MKTSIHDHCSRRLIQVSLLALAMAIAPAWIPSVDLSGAAFAESHGGGHDDGGHDDGGHDDGGHDDGGHDDGDHGDGGHGGGPGGKGKGGHGDDTDLTSDSGDTGATATALAGGNAAQPGSYVRFELGGFMGEGGNGFWLPPGYPSDPRINFGIDDLGAVAQGSMAFGYDWQNGRRADVSLTLSGAADVTAPCISTTDASPCSEHADITGGAVSTFALMGNFYYALSGPLGSSGGFEPFVTVGAGIARNKLDDWTRTANPDNDTGRPERTFEGGSSTDFAWTVGIGGAWQIDRPGKGPMYAEVTWRYHDYGTVEGSSTPLDPGEEPVQGLTFDLSGQSIGFGIRIPF